MPAQHPNIWFYWYSSSSLPPIEWDHINDWNVHICPHGKASQPKQIIALTTLLASTWFFRSSSNNLAIACWNVMHVAAGFVEKVGKPHACKSGFSCYSPSQQNTRIIRYGQVVIEGWQRHRVRPGGVCFHCRDRHIVVLANLFCLVADCSCDCCILSSRTLGLSEAMRSEALVDLC
jgi:hypothetical protein